MSAFEHIFWGASGLVKRYIIETGSETVDAIFAEAVGTTMCITAWGYLETYAIIQRRYHHGAYDRSVLTDAVTALQSDVILSGDFGLISIGDSAIFVASGLIDAHHVNSADAAILSAYLRFQSQLPPARSSCLLVAADKRLVRAASTEGLQTLNPELIAVSDVPALLASS